jgi:hypothetical protein
MTRPVKKLNRRRASVEQQSEVGVDESYCVRDTAARLWLSTLTRGAGKNRLANSFEES